MVVLIGIFFSFWFTSFYGIISHRSCVFSGERRRRSAENGTNQNVPGTTSPRLSPNEWQFAFDHVIYDADGRAQFTKFLQSEYSEENILFWWAVEELKTVCSSESRPEFERTVLEMFETFIASESPLAINIDHDTRTDIIDRLETPLFLGKLLLTFLFQGISLRVENQDPSSFPDNIYERAQAHVYRLMEKDCFSRFVHTPAYKEVAKKIGLPQTFRFNEKITPAC
ncbi:regulator of G protein signaling domain protein [Necator americanus]|uniref:Regulator of G protein signaling domain protein n=1 Tax=Necator americanus TaxID=51031 RepID=W2SXU7_NECAM|nr:regulator of G protein signaling domain protein [Necator americanus]ETN74460.1 regulator of G protein signaling domain protein [Necator americanus]